MHPQHPRIEILRAALACFAEAGFDASGASMIAARAGVAVEEVFAHFPSKHAFAMAMYRALVDDLRAVIADLPSGPVADRFAALLHAKLDLLDAQRPAMRALITAALDAQGPLGVLSDATAAVRAQMSGAVYAVVAGAADAPEERAPLARALYGVHLAIVLLWTQDDDGRMARAAVGLCQEMLAAVGPMLAMPAISERLARLDAVFGDRLTPLVSADVERRARWLLARLLRHRRLLVEAPDAPPGEDELAPHLPLVRAALASDRPLELVLPAFPAKSPNPEKTLGALPDMAERVALRALQSLCDELAEAHSPGVRLVLCSDGLVFADVVGVRDDEVAAYGSGIDALLAACPSLRRFDLAHAFGASSPDEARQRLLEGWGEDVASLLARLKASPSLGAQLDGMHRFVFEDDAARAPSLSRTQLRKHARAKAVEVLRRSRAWGRLLGECFPHALRLSIHPQPAVSDKIGVHLLPTHDAWLTPWHGAAVLDGDRFVLAKRRDAEARGATRVDVDGRPSHFTVTP